MNGDLFSAGFAWDDVATDATPVATREEAPATGAPSTFEAPMSQAFATACATNKAPSFSGDFAWSGGGVADVASVASEDMSHNDVAVAATVFATPETRVNAGFNSDNPAPVATVATVATWRAGVDLMARATDWPQIACCNWATLLSDARSFLNLWGEDAERFGWTTLDIFGTPASPASRRVDCLGLVQLLKGRPIQQMDARTALIGSHPAEQTYHRNLRAAGAVAFWDLLPARPEKIPASAAQGPTGDRGRGLRANALTPSQPRLSTRGWDTEEGASVNVEFETTTLARNEAGGVA